MYIILFVLPITSWVITSWVITQDVVDMDIIQDVLDIQCL